MLAFSSELTRPTTAQQAISEVMRPNTANLSDLLAATISAGPAHSSAIGVAELDPRRSSSDCEPCALSQKRALREIAVANKEPQITMLKKYIACHN